MLALQAASKPPAGSEFGTAGGARNSPSQQRRNPRRRRRERSSVRRNSQNKRYSSRRLRDLPGRARMKRTGPRGLISFEKGLTQYIRAVGRRQLAAQWIDLNDFNSRGWNKVGDRRSGRGLLHKLSPDRQRSLSAGEAELALAIEPYPY